MTVRELWADVAKRHKVHEETLFTTKKSLEFGFKFIAENETLDAARERLERFLGIAPDDMPFNGTIKEFRVPSDQVSDGVPITVYKPTQSARTPAIIVYFHGGGLVIGSRKTTEGCVRLMSKTCGAVVISAEYRLLPCPGENLAPFKDAITVTNWVLKNKETVGGCADSKLGVAGDSAGGQISCSVTCQISQLDFQILAYSVTDLHFNLPSFDEFRDIAAFNTKDMEIMFSKYGFPLSEVADNPHFNPSARKDVELSPPTLMIFAELDPLLDWGKTYADRLKTAGVQIEEVTFEGVPHGFFTIVQYFPTTAVAAHRRVAEFINGFQR